MGFTLNHNDTFNTTIEDGTYEVVIFSAVEDATPGGAEFINVDMIIRNDVPQKFQNSHIFHRIWRAKDTNQYNHKMFNTIGKAIGLENGKQYSSLQELLADFAMGTCRVKVKNETSEYNGKTYENLNVKSWDVSNVAGNLAHQFKNKQQAQQNNGSVINISDDDLPF